MLDPPELELELLEVAAVVPPGLLPGSTPPPPAPWATGVDGGNSMDEDEMGPFSSLPLLRFCDSDSLLLRSARYEDKDPTNCAKPSTVRGGM